MAMASTPSSISIHAPKTRFLIDSPKPHHSFHVITCRHDSNTPVKQHFSVTKTLSIPAVVITSLASSPLALAAKQIAESPQEDNRGLALLLPLVPAVGWVLFNILGPALNQINRMRSEKAVIVGLGSLGACCAAMYAPVANAASEVVEGKAAAASGGGSGLLPFIVAAAVGLEVVLFSTMQSKYEEKSE